MLQMATKETVQSAADERLTIREAAAICDVDYDTFLRWVHKGVLPYHVVGPHRLKRVYRSDVMKLIQPGA